MEHDVSSWPRAGAALHHWQWRPEWSPDRPCLYFYLVFDREAVAAAVDPEVLAAVEATPWLDAVPLEWTHLTVCDLGFVDEVPDEVVERATARLLRTVTGLELPTLTLGPLTGMESAVVLAAGPVDPLRRLHRLAREASEEALGAGREVVHRHTPWPHVSLGYVNRDVPAEEVRGLVDRWAHVRCELPVAGLVLAAVTRRRRHYQWTVRAAIGRDGPWPPAPWATGG